MQQPVKEYMAELESLFGSEEALGICFVDGDGKSYTLEEGSRFFQDHSKASFSLTSVFQNGDSATCCTNYAIHIRSKLGEDVKIYGFRNEDNPTARIVTEKMHPGGHDFAILNDRFLIDPWVKLVASKSNRVAFDIQDESDSVYINQSYGPKNNWRHMFEAEIPLPLTAVTKELA